MPSPSAEAPGALWIVGYRYDTDEAAVSLRRSLLEPHRAWIRARVAAGRLLAAGSHEDGSGAQLVFAPGTPAQLRDDLAGDPYHGAGGIRETLTQRWLLRHGPWASAVPPFNRLESDDGSAR